MTRLAQQLARLAADRRSLWLVLALALAVALPTLDAGLIGDDVAHQRFVAAQLESPAASPEAGAVRWWDMFVLVEGDAERTLGLRRAGRYPWWVDPDLRIRFFRPLSVATHYVDHWLARALWPGTVWPMHLHSVAWYLLACALVWGLARRLGSSAAVGTVAALWFALCYAHLSPVGWLAHRNATIATVFMLLAVGAHHRWRAHGWGSGAVLGPVSLLAALLSAELGLAGFGLLLAYALVLDRGPGQSWVGPLASLLVYVAVIVGWRLVYDALGYGAIGSGAYLDPIGDPLAYLAALPERLGWLLVLRFGAPLIPAVPSWLWWMTSASRAGVWLVFIAACMRGRVSARAARVTCFGLLGATIGLIPMTASIPGDRLLIPTSFGLAMVFGELINAWLLDGDGDGDSDARPGPFARAAACWAVVIALVIAPLAWLIHGAALDELRFSGDRPPHGAALPNAGLSRKALVIVHGRDHMSASHLPAARAAWGLEAPNFSWILHTGPREPEVVRIDARTLELRDPSGFVREPFAAYWRSVARRPFAVGDEVRTLDYVARVMAVNRGRPTAVRFIFRARLEHSSFVLAWWNGADYVAWSAPR